MIEGNGCAARFGNEPRFFAHRNSVFFENQPTQWPPADARDQYHDVKTLRNGRVVEVCGFRFTTSV